MKDIDFDRHEIVVRAGKGDKDRRVLLPERCVRPLLAILGTGQGRHRQDRRIGIRVTGLSPALVRKYPAAELE